MVCGRVFKGLLWWLERYSLGCKLEISLTMEGIQHNCPVGLRRYEPSISTAGKAADLILLMCYRMFSTVFLRISLFLFEVGGGTVWLRAT